MLAHDILNLLNELGKEIECEACRVLCVGFFLSYVIEITLKSHFWRAHIKLLSICMQRCYGRHYISCLKCKPLVIYRFLTHAVISHPGATSCEEWSYGARPQLFLLYNLIIPYSTNIFT